MTVIYDSFPSCGILSNSRKIKGICSFRVIPFFISEKLWGIAPIATLPKWKGFLFTARHSDGHTEKLPG